MPEPIKSMKLYSHLERINNELEELGIDILSPISSSDLSPFDNLHYYGALSVQNAILELRLKSNHKVLDVGSGLGGPARLMASIAGCHVTALELQPDMDTLASELTNRCKLADHINHICGDATTHDFGSATFDIITSWLAIYHIRDHQELFLKLADSMKSQGLIYVEDLICMGELSHTEKTIFEEKLYGQTLSTPETYNKVLEASGFCNILIQDHTSDWKQFTHNRVLEYRKQKERHIRVNGTNTYHAIEEFYSAVDLLFQSECIGGIIVQAQLK